MIDYKIRVFSVLFIANDKLGTVNCLELYFKSRAKAPFFETIQLETIYIYIWNLVEVVRKWVCTILDEVK